MFSVLTKRLVEQAVLAFVGGFASILAASGGGLTRAILVGSLGAGLRAVYGVFASLFGDKNTPSVM